MDKIIEKVVNRIESKKITPYLSLCPTIVIIRKSEGEDAGASSYLKSLYKTAKLYDVDILEYIANTFETAAKHIVSAIQEKRVSGIIVISNYGKMNQVLYDLIPTELDIDSLSRNSIGKLINQSNTFDTYENAPCTAMACAEIIKELNKGSDDFSNSKCLILGRSIRVGRPLAEILTQQNMTVTLGHSKSPENLARTIDWDTSYIVSAIGKPNYWNDNNQIYLNDYDKNNIIDVGMNVDKDGKLCGDVDKNWIQGKINRGIKIYINPVVGGVGKVTTTVLFAKLFYNKYKKCLNQPTPQDEYYFYNSTNQNKKDNRRIELL